MPPKDYYKILGINRNSTPAEIKEAFRGLAKQYHPDVNDAPDAKKQFQEINEAWQILRNTDTKEQYDSSFREPEPIHKQKRKNNYSDPYESMLRPFFDLYGYSNTQAQRDDEIKMPEHDWALITTIREAHLAQAPGKWYIKPSIKSMSAITLPDYIYSIRKDFDEKGQSFVTVYRTITDWLDDPEREEPIMIGGEMRNPKNRISLYTLGKGTYMSEPGIHIPHDFKTYQDALYSIAWKATASTIKDTGPFICTTELNIIEAYNSGNLNRRGFDDEDTLVTSNLKDFWETANKYRFELVEYRTVPKTPEGKYTGPEGQK